MGYHMGIHGFSMVFQSFRLSGVFFVVLSVNFRMVNGIPQVLDRSICWCLDVLVMFGVVWVKLGNLLGV